MKNLAARLGPFVFLAFFAFAGCADEREEAAVQEKTTAEEVGEETRDAMETTRDYVGEKSREASEFAKETTDQVVAYTSEMKQEYQAKMNAWLASFDDRVAELRDDARQLGTGAQANLERQIAELDEMKEYADEKLANMQDKGSDAWVETKKGLDDAMKRMETAYQEAKADLKR